MTELRGPVALITAVFAAVSAGLVIAASLPRPAGTAGPPQTTTASGDAGAAGTALAAQNQALRDRLAELSGQSAANDRYLTELATSVLARRLSGVDVLVLTTAAGQPYADGVTTMLAVAGATVVATMTITDRFTDPGHSAELLELTNRLRTTGPQPSAAASPVAGYPDAFAAAGALLADVLFGAPGGLGTPGVESDEQRNEQRHNVITGLSASWFLVCPSPPRTAARAIVMVSGPADDERIVAIQHVVVELDRAGPVLFAGSDDRIVAALRADPATAVDMSTVDNVDTVAGRLVAAWGLAEQLAGRVGHYGTAVGASLLPSSP